MSSPTSEPAQNTENGQELALTPWALDEIAAGYDEWDNTICWVFGYPFVFQALGLPGSVSSALDVGCGPGFVAEHIARTYGIPVVAADSSPGMIRRAKENHTHPDVTYQLMEQGRLEVPDASVDAAYCCFVFITIPDLDTIRDLVSQAYRALRPGGRFAVLEVHPDSTGVRFVAFQVGEPGRTYGDGDLKRTRLYEGEQAVELVDVHWTASTIAGVLADCGFTAIASQAPLLADAQPVAEAAAVERFDWQRERDTPPFLILSGHKPRQDRQ